MQKSTVKQIRGANVTMLAMFVLICITGAITYLYLPEHRHVRNNNRLFAYAACLVLVAFFGYIGWRRQPQKWVSHLWIIGYASVLGVLIITKAFSIFIYTLPPVTFFFLYNVCVFFSSPLPFMSSYMLFKVLPGKDNKNVGS